MKRRIKLIVAATAGLVITANAATVLVDPSDVYAHNDSSNYSGTLSDVVIGSGIDGSGVDDVGHPVSHPSLWEATHSGYQSEFQSANLLDSGTSINAKIGWIGLDLGSAVTNLDEMYLWNIREDNGRGLDEYNVYYATSLSIAFASDADYDFSGTGWTLLTNGNLSNRFAGGGEATKANGIVAFGGITAQYIGIEMISNNGSSKTGLSEIAITTVVPEPTTTALLGLGGLALIFRRRK